MNKRKIILNLCTSLDSYIEGPNGEIDWCFTDQDYSMTNFLIDIDTIFIGRKSYEQLVREMPNAFSNKKIIVFSKTMIDKKGSMNIISGNIEAEVAKIANEAEKNIWLFGGASLISNFMNLNLVHELMISVHPIILGKGKPLFLDLTDRRNLELKDTIVFSTGLVQLLYTLKGK